MNSRLKVCRSADVRNSGTAFSSPTGRYCLYTLMAGGFFLLALGLMLARVLFAGKQFNFLLSDAKSYYLYLPSLVIDGDLDFSNEIRTHWGTAAVAALERRTPTGLVANKYPIGLALTLTPPFLVAHACSLMLHPLTGAEVVTPNGYTLIYQILVLLWIMALGLVSMILVDRLMTDHFGLSPRSVVLGIATYWAGSHYSYYYFVEPFMVHVVSNSWVVIVTVLAWLISKRLKRGEPLSRLSAALGFALSMAVVCRPSNVVFLGVVLFSVLTAIRVSQIRSLLRAVPVMWLCGAIPILLQLMVWHATTGEFIHYSYEGERFQWLKPALWQTLFSSRHGLFFWSPLLLFSVAGLFRRFAIRGISSDLFFLCQAMSAILLWYINSCWTTWWFGDAFGGRAFLELSTVFISGLSSFFEYSREVKFSWLVLALACAVAYNYGLMSLYILAVIPRGDALF